MAVTIQDHQSVPKWLAIGSDGGKLELTAEQCKRLEELWQYNYNCPPLLRVALGSDGKRYDLNFPEMTIEAGMVRASSVTTVWGLLRWPLGARMVRTGRRLPRCASAGSASVPWQRRSPGAGLWHRAAAFPSTAGSLPTPRGAREQSAKPRGRGLVISGMLRSEAPAPPQPNCCLGPWHC
uniref:Uncharacterized protein n=1 Tax=Pyrodinium bahamense TaxID=73915 RepID=A0A7S0FIX7_9DINO